MGGMAGVDGIGINVRRVNLNRVPKNSIGYFGDSRSLDWATPTWSRTPRPGIGC